MRNISADLRERLMLEMRNLKPFTTFYNQTTTKSKQVFYDIMSMLSRTPGGSMISIRRDKVDERKKLYKLSLRGEMYTKMILNIREAEKS